MSATHRRNKANIDAFWLRPVKSIVILSSAPLGATCKRKALRKAPKHGHPNQARALRVYADWRSSASADEGARAPHAENLRSQARRSPWQRAQPAPLLGMAASFVAQDGSLTDQHPVHGCRFFNPADEQLAQLIVRVWPWFHSKRLNGVTVLDYGQAMGLCLEFNRDMAADVKARSILLSYARPTALVRVLKIMVTACKLQAQGPMNQASATVLLLKSAAAMSPQHKLDSALQDADLIDKPDPGGNLSPFQRAFTWGLMQEAGAGTPGIAWLLRFDDLTRAARDVPTLEALRIRAIEMGRIEKWVPPPQPNPAAAAAPAAAAPAVRRRRRAPST